MPNLSFLCLEMAEIDFHIFAMSTNLPWQPYTKITFQVNCYLFTKSGPSTLSDS